MMTNENTPDDSTHPMNMDADAHKAAMAALDDEEAVDTTSEDAGEPTTTEEGAPAKDDEPDEGAPPAPKGEGEGDDEGKAEDPPGDTADDDEKVDAKAFKGVLAELRETREQMKALKAQHTAVPELPQPKDFKAEKDALKEKWENGDLDTDDYHDQREALTLEEAEHRAAARFLAMQQQAQVNSSTAAWQEKVTAWEQQNADFLGNPIRRKAVDDLMTALDSDPNNKLSDEELLAKVEATAFEAFNWTPAEAAPAPANGRQQAAARAAAAASSAPPAMAGGVGNAATAGKLDLEAIVSNPEKYGKQARAAVDSALGEEA